jgi:hypothetical protein
VWCDTVGWVRSSGTSTSIEVSGTHKPESFRAATTREDFAVCGRILTRVAFQRRFVRYGLGMAAAVTVLLAATVPSALGQVSTGGTPAPTPLACREGLNTVQAPPPADVRVTDDHVNVLLPPGYCSDTERYPVLYLLHGAGDTYQSWAAQTDLVSFARSYRVIIVMPDGVTTAWLGGTPTGSTASASGRATPQP